MIFKGSVLKKNQNPKISENVMISSFIYLNEPRKKQKTKTRAHGPTCM